MLLSRNRGCPYVIPGATIRFVHSDLSYVDHVKLTLDAVKALK